MSYEIVNANFIIPHTHVEAFKAAMIETAKQTEYSRWKRFSDYATYEGAEGQYKLASEHLGGLVLQPNRNGDIAEMRFSDHFWRKPLDSPFLHTVARFASGHVDVREITTFEHYRLSFDGEFTIIQGKVTVTYPATPKKKGCQDSQPALWTLSA